MCVFISFPCTAWTHRCRCQQHIALWRDVCGFKTCTPTPSQTGCNFKGEIRNFFLRSDQAHSCHANTETKNLKINPDISNSQLPFPIIFGILNALHFPCQQTGMYVAVCSLIHFDRNAYPCYLNENVMDFSQTPLETLPWTWGEVAQSGMNLLICVCPSLAHVAIHLDLWTKGYSTALKNAS